MYFLLIFSVVKWIGVGKSRASMITVYWGS